MKITPNGDVELWLAKGKTRIEEDRNLYWQIPMLAKPGKMDGNAVYVVSPGTAINNDQYRLLSAALSPLATLKRDNRWVVEYHLFQDRFEKAPGITPKAYVRWKTRPSGEGPEIDEEPPAASEKDDQFIDWLAKRVDYDKPELCLVWRIITRSIPEYIMSTGNSVNLTFCKIGALPYRVNWKNIAVSRNPELARIYKLTTRQQSELIKYSDAVRHLRTSDLIEYTGALRDDRRTFAWNLEIVPSQSWDFYSKKIERDVKLAMADHYTTHWANSVTKNENFIHECLSVFTRKISRPCARVRQCADTGVLSFAQKYRVRPLRRNRLWTFTDTTACLPDPETWVDGPEDEEDVVEEDDGLLSMPPVFTSE